MHRLEYWKFPVKDWAVETTSSTQRQLYRAFGDEQKKVSTHTTEQPMTTKDQRINLRRRRRRRRRCSAAFPSSDSGILSRRCHWTLHIWKLYKTRIPSCTAHSIHCGRDPQSKEGKGVEKWGVWERDPGPRGISFDQFAQFVDGGKKEAEAGWPIDTEEFWLKEHGVWIETPRYDLEPRRYLVTGGEVAQAF